MWGLLAAGGVLALIELVCVLGFGRSLFLSTAELLSYAWAAWTALPLLVLLLGLMLRPGARPDRVGFRARIALGAAALLSGGWVGWSLTAGRRVRDLAYRPLLVLAIAVLLSVAVILGMRTATALRTRGTKRPAIVWAVLCFSTAACALFVDAWVLPRGYPAFHGALFVGALYACAVAVVAAPSGLALPSTPMRAWATALVCAGMAPLSLFFVARQANTSFAVSETAPFTAKLLAPALGIVGPRRAVSHDTTSGPEPALLARTTRGINLQDKDVLLITVDALRADMLAAYGGKGDTRALDQIAREGMVFQRAYTPAPHTSYALASMLTAKFMKPVLELPGAERDHPTLPDLLRRYGYRTAAFYPPAIFFVDGSNFDVLRARGFGFEYRKEMYASAPQRVSQLEAYLSEAEPKHPLFVWVHLFEPHEPYEPPPEFRSGDSPRERYEGEVRAADHAIGELVRVFRAARPGATVIVTADHGEEFGEHGGRYHGSTLYDEQVRVPLIWSSPGEAVAGSSEVPVELVDIGTTLLQAAGVPPEARMRGDDLGAVLRGDAQGAPQVAFASVEQQYMVTDGKLKVVCAGERAHCQLFDLRADPGELRNLAAERPQEVERLRSEIDRFVSTIPRTEALAVANGIGLPEALARAKLGVAGVGPDLVPLLADSREPVRAAAARALGELPFAPATPTLERLRTSDPAPEVRAEAAIAVLLLGSAEAVPDVSALLSAPASSDGGALPSSVARRAALALADHGQPEALSVLAELALDDRESEADRARAIAALGASRARAALDPLIALLADVRLRAAAAAALAQVGGTRARHALAKQLAEERYEPARRVEARGLAELGDPRVVPLVLRFLGMESSIPDGVRLLLEVQAKSRGRVHAWALAEGVQRHGTWECAGERCKPGEDAEVTVRPSAKRGQDMRVTWLVDAHGPQASLVVDGQVLPLRAGEQQVSLVRAGQGAMRMRVSSEGEAAVIAIAAAPVQPEIPPPAAEPWDAGAPQDAGTDAATLHSP